MFWCFHLFHFYIFRMTRSDFDDTTRKKRHQWMGGKGWADTFRTATFWCCCWIVVSLWYDNFVYFVVLFRKMNNLNFYFQTTPNISTSWMTWWWWWRWSVCNVYSFKITFQPITIVDSNTVFTLSSSTSLIVTVAAAIAAFRPHFSHYCSYRCVRQHRLFLSHNRHQFVQRYRIWFMLNNGNRCDNNKRCHHFVFDYRCQHQLHRLRVSSIQLDTIRYNWSISRESIKLVDSWWCQDDDGRHSWSENVLIEIWSQFLASTRIRLYFSNLDNRHIYDNHSRVIVCERACRADEQKFQ